MQNNEPLPTTVRFGSSDHRAELSNSMRRAEDAVARTPVDAWSAATPCEELNVAQLVRHILFVGQRLEAMYTGQAEGEFDSWDELDADPHSAAASIADANARVEALLRDDAILDRVINPWRPMTIRESLPCYVSEYTVHTWDLATAAHLDIDWNADVIDLSQEAMECEIPAEYRAAIFGQVLAEAPADMKPPFGDARPTPANATPIERLAAYVGRNV